MKFRVSFLLAAILLPILSRADWVAVPLSPTGVESSLNGVAMGQQVGSIRQGEFLHARLWSGSAGSIVSLHPAGAEGSNATGTDGVYQVGYAILDGTGRASLWSGTSASWTDLHPQGAFDSVAYAVSGGKQVGYVNGRAAMWSGTPESVVNLHPDEFSESEALGMSGDMQVGYASDPLGRMAVLWRGSAASLVNLHPNVADASMATCTNGTLQGGFSVFSGASHAGIWSGTAESWTDFHPENAFSSRISGMAGDYQVGVVDSRATIWMGTAESRVDLHSYLPSRYTYSAATGVSVVGSEIFVSGYAGNSDTGQIEAMLWIRQDFSLALNKSAIAGQNSVLGTIALTGPRTGHTTFRTFSNSSVVQMPSTVTVFKGNLTRSFRITTNPVGAPLVTTIHAQLGTTIRTQTLTLTPLIPTAMAFSPSQVPGGQSTSCRLVINGVAGPSGRVISIFDNSAYASVPTTVTVPPGASSVIFPITTSAVPSPQVVRVTARVSAGEKTGTFRILP